MMQYLAWRVMTGLNNYIEVSFMMVGHTKFAPDWAFGLLKQKFRRSKVGCLQDLVRIRLQSTMPNWWVVRMAHCSYIFSQHFKRQDAPSSCFQR
jgi:hypothetical protein